MPTGGAFLKSQQCGVWRALDLKNLPDLALCISCSGCSSVSFIISFNNLMNISVPLSSGSHSSKLTKPNWGRGGSLENLLFVAKSARSFGQPGEPGDLLHMIGIWRRVRAVLGD